MKRHELLLEKRVKGQWSQQSFTCSKLTIETLKQGMKYVQILQ